MLNVKDPREHTASSQSYTNTLLTKVQTGYGKHIERGVGSVSINGRSVSKAKGHDQVVEVP